MAIAFVRAIPAAGTLGDDNNPLSLTTAYDATGCDALVVGISAGCPSGVGSATVTVQTYAGAALTTFKTFIANAGSATGGAGLYGILLPTTGSNNVIMTLSGQGADPSTMTLCAAGYSGVASFGNTGTANPASSTANSPACNVTAASGNLVVGIGAHGDTISGAGTGNTLRGVVNNFSTANAAGCLALVDIPGNGGATGILVASSVSDAWTMHGVELVAAGGATSYARGRSRTLVGLKIR